MTSDSLKPSSHPCRCRQSVFVRPQKKKSHSHRGETLLRWSSTGGKSFADLRASETKIAVRRKETYRCGSRRGLTIPPTRCCSATGTVRPPDFLCSCPATHQKTSLPSGCARSAAERVGPR